MLLQLLADIVSARGAVRDPLLEAAEPRGALGSEFGDPLGIAAVAWDVVGAQRELIAGPAFRDLCEPCGIVCLGSEVGMARVAVDAAESQAYSIHFGHLRWQIPMDLTVLNYKS